ncbi:MAG TPA: cytidine/deoxycytidylate deaminase family protein [Candidatus Paceibacterota bacterium]|jgi:Deoxycytidylate deaminase
MPKINNAAAAKHFRPSWDDYFMAIVKIIATRGTCDRLYAGSVLVKDKRIIATGYNGSPAGLPHCDDVGHLLEEGHCVRTVHGEHNSLLQAARQGGTSTEGSTMYTKYSPCIHCTKYIISAGVKRVVVGQIYRNPQALELLKDAGVTVDLYKESAAWRSSLVSLFSENIPVKVNEGKVKMKIVK